VATSNKAKSNGGKSNQNGNSSRLGSAWNLVFLAAGALLALLVASLVNKTPGAESGGDGAAPAQSSLSRGLRGLAGPWGIIEEIPIVLERPEEYFAIDPTPPPKILWFFPNHTASQLQDFFYSCGIADDLLPHLLDRTQWRETPQGIWVEPSMETVRDLKAAPRERIYRLLAQSPENIPHRYPFVYRLDGFDEWFAASGLPVEKVRQIREMTYRRNNMLCFSDGQYWQLTMPASEVRLLARTLSRVPTMILNVRVPPGCDTSGLLDYWGTSPRMRSLVPMLNAMSRARDGVAISATYFFPPVPRLLAYSYPNPTNSIAPKPPDCFWTAMNFFHDQPDHGFFDSEKTKLALRTEYHQVPKAERFGDIILLYEPGAEMTAVHMCVHIADDIVFTKNGADLFQPWVLMRFSDMMVNYPTEKPLQMAFFRRLQR